MFVLRTSPLRLPGTFQPRALRGLFGLVLLPTHPHSSNLAGALSNARALVSLRAAGSHGRSLLHLQR